MINDLKKHETDLQQKFAELADDPIAAAAVLCELKGFQSAILIAESAPKPTAFSPVVPLVCSLMFFGIGWMCCASVVAPKIVEVDRGLSSEVTQQLSIAVTELRKRTGYEFVPSSKTETKDLTTYSLFKLVDSKMKNPEKPWQDSHRGELEKMGTTGQRMVAADKKQFGE